MKKNWMDIRFLCRITSSSRLRKTKLDWANKTRSSWKTSQCVTKKRRSLRFFFHRKNAQRKINLLTTRDSHCHGRSTRKTIPTLKLQLYRETTWTYDNVSFAIKAKPTETRQAFFYFHNSSLMDIPIPESSREWVSTIEANGTDRNEFL